jgi:glycosyltransferase involved in cell wall biosynthesis
MKEEIAKTGFPADRITVIPNGCDFELFADNNSSSSALRARYAWLGDRPLISYVGAIGRINAVDYLVEVAARALNLDPEVRFAVIGTGIEEANVHKLADERGVRGKNFFMMGPMPKRKAALWVSASTMTIALVRGPRFIWKDATQNKYFDSLAAGKPVASNYDGWQAKVASDAGAGIILDSIDYSTAATRLIHAVRDRRWLESAAQAAINLAHRCYSRDSQAAEIEKILAAAIRAYGRR